MGGFWNLALKGEGWDTSRRTDRAAPLSSLPCSLPAPSGCSPSMVPSVPLLRVTAKAQGNGHRLQQGKLQPGTRQDDFPEGAGVQGGSATSVFGGIQKPAWTRLWATCSKLALLWAGGSRSWCLLSHVSDGLMHFTRARWNVNTSVLVTLVLWDAGRKDGKLTPPRNDSVD